MLCSSCGVKHQLHYDGLIGNSDRCTVKLSLPNKWKVVNAELATNQLKLEYDRGSGIEKQAFSVSHKSPELYSIMQFRGVNKLDGLTLLYFTKVRDSQPTHSLQLSTANVSTALRIREEYAIFRTDNWLMIHFSIENTSIGNLLFTNLRKKFYRGDDTDQRVSFKPIDDALLFEFGKNYSEKRSFPIQNFMKPHESLGNNGGANSFCENKLVWTWHYEIDSKQE
ncbi:hypothetical protein C6497_00355 [Candidatus Poribacteria bacterium]|nr:MAG: hypothetical protein C6497_00355 [Candidatus Poribacteria bacterium]